MACINCTFDNCHNHIISIQKIDELKLKEYAQKFVEKEHEYEFLFREANNIMKKIASGSILLVDTDFVQTMKEIKSVEELLKVKGMIPEGEP